MRGYLIISHIHSRAYRSLVNGIDQCCIDRGSRLERRGGGGGGVTNYRVKEGGNTESVSVFGLARKRALTRAPDSRSNLLQPSAHLFAVTYMYKTGKHVLSTMKQNIKQTKQTQFHASDTT